MPTQKIGTQYRPDTLGAVESDNGLNFQQELFLDCLKHQAETGGLRTNPNVSGHTSFAKAILAFIDDNKAPKTCKNLYKYLKEQGWYDITERGKIVMTDLDTNRIRLI